MGRTLIVIILAALAGWYVGIKFPQTAAIADGAIQIVKDQEFIQNLGISGDDEDGDEDLAPEDDGVDSAEASDDASNEEEAADAPTPRPASRDAGGEQNPDQYRAWISEARARHPYPESEERMYAVMMCESGGDAAIVNPAGPYSGLFQYSPATWSGDWNTYRNEDILDPRAQIFATALAWSNGMQSQWGCYSHAQ